MGNYFEFDVELDKSLVDNGMIDELFYLKDLRQRKLFLNADIDQFTVADIVKNIMQYNCDDKDIPPTERTPIRLYVVSNGGDVDAGFELIDIIQSSKTPVYTINLGFQYSMGFLIGLAGLRLRMRDSLCTMELTSVITPVPRCKTNWRFRKKWTSESRLTF